MTRPADIDPEAMQLLDEADWPWSDAQRAFVEARDPDRETTGQYRDRRPARVTYDELRDHGLAGVAPAGQRTSGLRWLREALSAERQK